MSAPCPAMKQGDKMRRLIWILLAACMLSFLPACGSEKKPEDKVEVMATLADTAQVLGYDLLAYDTSDSTLEFTSTAVVNDSIGQATYQNGKSNVTLRMTLDREKAEGLAGFRNAGTAGAIEAPTDVFSKLSIQVVDGTTYFCEFTYTSCGCPCYLSLSETKTNLDFYSQLLIDYINQLYNMEGIPSYVRQLDPSMNLEDEAPELSVDDVSAEESEQSAADAETTTEEQAEEPAEAPAEEKTQEKSEKNTAQQAQEKTGEEKSQKQSEEETEKKTEEKSEKQSEEKTEEKKDAEKESEKKKSSEEQPKGSITLTYYDITLVSIGDAYTFEPKGGSGGYQWKSADPKIASVSDDGTVRAEGKGTTTVTVTSGDGLSVDVIVRVPGK